VAEASVLIDNLTFAEGLRWHDSRVWVSDMYNRRVISTREDGSDLRVEGEFDATPVGLGWLPDGRLLVIQQDAHTIIRREHDGTYVLHADLRGLAQGLLNDLVVASDGTAYTGCFGFDIYHDVPYETAPLIRVSPDGSACVVGEPAHFPNGMVLFDGKLAVAESFGNRISVYDVQSDGSLAGRRDWATFGPLPTAVDLNDRYGQLVIASDGISCPDAEGAIWVASFTHQHALRVMPGGDIVDLVTTGDMNCFSVALGGEDGRSLFLCATPAELDPVIRKNEPRSRVMIARVAVPAS